MAFARSIPVLMLFLSGVIPGTSMAEERGSTAGSRGELRRTVNAAVRRLGSPSWNRRHKAADQVRLMKDAATPALLSALHSQSAQIRLSAFRLLVFTRRSPSFAATVLRTVEPGSELWILLTKKGRRKISTGELDHLAFIRSTGFYGGPRCVPALLSFFLEARSSQDLNAVSEALTTLENDDEVARRLIDLYGEVFALWRRQILVILGDVCSRASLAFLRSQLNHEEEPVRKQARISLSRLQSRLYGRTFARRIAGPKGDTWLARAKRLLEKDEVFGRQLFSDLAASRDPTALARVLRLLRASRWWFRLPPALFGAREDERWIGPLIRAYGDAGSIREKHWILDVLAEHPGHPAAARHLAEALLDPDLAEFAKPLIADLCGTLSPVLGDLARQSPEPARRKILEELAAHGGWFGALEITRTLEAVQPPYAPELLLTMAPTLAVHHLTACLNNPSISLTCARLLGRLGKTAGLDCLLKLIDRGLACGEVLEGLGKTRDRDAFQPLIRFLRHPRLGPAALRGLVHLADPRSLPLFRRLLENAIQPESALRGLLAVGDREALSSVRAFARTYRFRWEKDAELYQLTLEVYRQLESR